MSSDLNESLNGECKLSETNKRCAHCETRLRGIFKKWRQSEKKDLSADELIKLLRTELQSTIHLFEDALNDIECRFNEEALRAKDDIDVRIESLKAELDNYRDKLHENIDEKYMQLKKEFGPNKVKEIETEFEELSKSIKDEKDETLDELEDFIDTFTDEVQDAFDFTLKINFREGEVALSPDFVGTIEAISSIVMPNSDWKYTCEDFDCSRFLLLKRIELDNFVKNIKYLGNDLLAVNLRKQIKIFNTKSGECVTNLPMEWCDIYPLKDGKMLTVASQFYVTVWDLKTLEKFQVHKENIEGVINCVIQLANGTVVFEQHDADEKIGFFNLDGLKLKFLNKIENAHEDQILCLLELPDGQLASGSMDHTIKIWSVASLSLVRVLSGHESDVFSIILGSGKEIVTFCRKNKVDSIRVWDYESGECKKVIETDGAIESLFRLPFGQFASFEYDSDEKTRFINFYEPEKHELRSQFDLKYFEFEDEKHLRQKLQYVDNGAFANSISYQINIFNFQGDVLLDD